MVGFWSVVRADFRTGAPLVLWVFLTFVVGLAGPFGTYPTFDLWQRLLFWAVNIGFCIIIGTMTRALIYGMLGFQERLPGFVMVALLLALTLPSLIFFLIGAMLGPAYHDAPGPLELALFVFCTSMGISAYRNLTRPKAANSPALLNSDVPVPTMPPAAKDALPDAGPRLIRRLPPQVRGGLMSISVRDHYVDVTTDRGRASLLLRLGDAVAEVDGVEGAQVHRSHWVAWGAVRQVDRTGNKLTLVMKDGRRVPVSRTYRTLVEARGLGIARAVTPPHKTASAPPPNSRSNAGSSAHSPPV